MASLNPVIRRAIYEVLDAYVRAFDGDKEWEQKINFLRLMVPSYWEEPSELPDTGAL